MQEEIRKIPTFDATLANVEMVTSSVNEKSWRFFFEEESGELPRLEVNTDNITGTHVQAAVTTNHDVVLTGDQQTKKRKVRATQKPQHKKDHLKALNLSSDEVDYFYGAFCDASAEENPKQISLAEYLSWLKKWASQGSKLDEIEADYEFLVEMVKSIHYWDELEIEKRLKHAEELKLKEKMGADNMAKIDEDLRVKRESEIKSKKMSEEQDYRVRQRFEG